jgi:hypothetical protein
MTAHEPRTASVGHAGPTCRRGRAGAPCGIPLVASGHFPGYLQHAIPPRDPHYPEPLRTSSALSRSRPPSVGSVGPSASAMLSSGPS